MSDNKPVMGNQTPRTEKAVADAWTLPTCDHRLGYLISFAQGLELELVAAMEYGHKHRLEAALAKQSAQPEPCKHRWFPENGNGVIQCIFCKTFGERVTHFTPCGDGGGKS